MIKTIALRTAITAIAIGCAGCTDAQQASWWAYGSPHNVKFYSGGVLVQEWTSTGRVATVKDSDGWEFKDAKTGAFVRVSGDVVITIASEAK